MKRIVALLICILTVFSCPFNAFAEDNSEIITDPPVTLPSHPQLGPEFNDTAHPEWKVINGINVTFYVANGRAYATYAVSAKKNGVTVSVKIEKRTLGFIWVDIGDGKQEKTDKNYISGSYSVPVSESGMYRIAVEVKCNGEKVTKTSSFDYDHKILMGDANSDGGIHANDARLILRFSAKLEKFSNQQKNICDIDKNGYITAADARIALRMAAKLI